MLLPQLYEPAPPPLLTKLIQIVFLSFEIRRTLSCLVLQVYTKIWGEPNSQSSEVQGKLRILFLCSLVGYLPYLVHDFSFFFFWPWGSFSEISPTNPGYAKPGIIASQRKFWKGLLPGRKSYGECNESPIVYKERHRDCVRGILAEHSFWNLWLNLNPSSP